MRIVVDAMGGDNAPSVVVEGAILAVREYGFEIVLVGSQAAIEDELEKGKNIFPNISVRHASEVIEMDEPAALSIKRKRDSSIIVGVDLVKSKEAQAFVSAGNTGAVVCASTLGMRLLEGVERPGIAIIFPTLKGISLLIDAGANIDPKPSHLLQYGIMGKAFSHYILKKPNPSVGLLNVGEEESKGTDFVKETYQLLTDSKLNFIGNVEGRDIFHGTADVIVCDGFIGNVVLKVSESLAETLSEFLRRELTKSFITKVGAFLSGPAFRALKKEIDYSEYGGAPLLGVDGICIISHGRSSAKAIKNAIRQAGEFVNYQVNQHIVEGIKNNG